MRDGPEEDRADALEANDAFYRALSNLDLPAMEELWAQHGFVVCVHPGWGPLEGWPTVRQSFEQIFTNTKWIKVVPTSLTVEVAGDVAIVTCAENITTAHDGEVAVAVAQATNVFRREGGAWRLIVHHASPAPVSVTQPFSGTVQ